VAPVSAEAPHGVHRVEVLFSDCDPARLVFYPRFFEWFDRATWTLFRTAGLEGDRLGAVIFPLVDIKATFAAPVRWGETLEIASTILEWRRSSFRIRHEGRVAGDRRLASDETRVWSVPGAGTITPTAVPQAIRDALPAREPSARSPG
jgi:4-hydroxybenzoyl-CoA thioesterase